MSKITIITLTYNREHLLPRAIESVLSQTFTDIDYQIVNNGSTDGTQDVIDRYCKMDSRISYVKNALNTKIYPCSVNEDRVETFSPNSPYFMRIDDDDFMEPTTAETLYRLITEYDADVATVGSKYVFPDGTTKNKFVFDGTFVYSRVEAMVEMLKREKFNTSSGGKIFSKRTTGITIPGVEVIRDIHCGYRRINQINRMVVTGEPLFYFYRHGNNLSGLDTAEQITPAKMRQHLKANSIRTKWLTENMPEIKDYVFYSELSFMLSLYERIHRLKVESCYNIAQEMKETLIKNKQFLSGCGHCTEREKDILKSQERE